MEEFKRRNNLQVYFIDVIFSETTFLNEVFPFPSEKYAAIWLRGDVVKKEIGNDKSIHSVRPLVHYKPAVLMLCLPFLIPQI